MKGNSARAPVEHQGNTVAVVDVSRMHHDVQQQAERVDERVVLDALDLLARVKSDRVDASPPFLPP